MTQVVEDRLLTVDDVARRCNVSDKTIRRWIKEGHLACSFVGPAKRIRIDPAELARLMHTNGDGQEKS